MILLPCEYTKTHLIVCFRIVNCSICALFLPEKLNAGITIQSHEISSLLNFTVFLEDKRDRDIKAICFLAGPDWFWIRTPQFESSVP